MNPPEINDPLDELLLKQNDYIDDDGFTSRVMAALPYRQRQRAWIRPFFLFGVMTIGSVPLILWLPWENLVISDFSSLLLPNSPAFMTCILIGSVLGSLIWSAISIIPRED